jgi:3-isopropylmalate dehydrogenase
MGFAGGLWQSRWKAIAPEHPHLKTRHLYSDACSMELVRDPSQFDVIVTGNLFGDLLSDLSAQLIGGMGIAPSANLNPDTGQGLYEPVHGSAPKLAGRGIVNPVGAILSSSMMLAQLGFVAESKAIEDAVIASIRARECTVDIGGELSTGEAGDAVVRHLRT